MQITLVSSSGSGTVSTMPVAEDTTLQDLVKTTQGGGRFRITVKNVGQSEATTRDPSYVLRDGDTVAVSPADVKGAAKAGAVGGGVKKGGAVVGNTTKGKGKAKVTDEVKPVKKSK